MDSSALGSLIKYQSNIQLEDTSSYEKTNDYGIAYLNLLVLQGKSGMYKLTFSAQGAISKSSSAFKIVNPIGNVLFARNLSQTIEVLLFFYSDIFVP